VHTFRGFFAKLLFSLALSVLDLGRNGMRHTKQKGSSKAEKVWAVVKLMPVAKVRITRAERDAFGNGD
jgi:hypothetical protein